MNPSQHGSGSRLRDLFLDALEIANPGERADFLDRACANDIPLRNAVETLLKNHVADGFLESPLLHSGALLEKKPNADLAAHREQIGGRIGRYRLLEQIGEGGCGIVYMAEQEEPVRRRVALKVIKLGMDTRAVIARFEAERQALAMMDHPNIARVLDAGSTASGSPYFVMELVRGVKITEYCDANNLALRERIGLFLQVCQAIQHAHQKGVIHRDIKPSNILTTLHDGIPIPKVIDFGIAKAIEQRLTEKTLFTAFQSFVGTPAYSSPEQAEMSGLDIDTRSDVYSLGVLLYELLTGSTPFDPVHLSQSSLDEMRRIIREEEPPLPSRFLRALSRTKENENIALVQGDLDAITMKCLEKDRSRRYATVNGLALDLTRWVDGDPILARPATSFYRFEKLLRKHKTAFAAAALFAVVLLLGAGVSIWQAVRATRAERVADAAQLKERQLRRRAEEESARSRLNEYVADINLAHQSLLAGNYARADQLLKKHSPQPGDSDLRGFEWHLLWKMCQGDDHSTITIQDERIQSLSFSPNGDMLAIGSRDSFKVWNLRTRTMLATLPKGFASPIFSPDGKSLITSSQSRIQIFDSTSWLESKTIPGYSGPLAVSANGNFLVASTREGLCILDMASWNEISRLRGASAPMAISPNGEFLAANTRDGVRLWSLKYPKTAAIKLEASLSSNSPRAGFAQSLAFSPDNRSLALTRSGISTDGRFIMEIWDTASGTQSGFIPPSPDPQEHSSAITSLSFSRDGTLVASGSWDHSIRFWDFKTGKPKGSLQGHFNEIWAIAFSPDGETLASGSKDGGVNLWPVHQKSENGFIAGDYQPFGLSSDGMRLAAISDGRQITFLNLSDQKVEQQFPLQYPQPSRWQSSSVAISADFKLFVQTDRDGEILLTKTATGETKRLGSPGGRVEALTLSPDGARLILKRRDVGNQILELNTGRQFPMETRGDRVTFSGNGRLFASFGRGNIVDIWNAGNYKKLSEIHTEPRWIFTAALSSDGSLLATGADQVDASIQLYDTRTGKYVGSCLGHKQPVFSMAFSPVGNTLASASADGTIKLWNMTTHQELLTIRCSGDRMTNLRFSANGKTLIAESNGATPGIRYFQTSSGGELTVSNKLR